MWYNCKDCQHKKLNVIQNIAIETTSLEESKGIWTKRIQGLKLQGREQSSLTPFEGLRLNVLLSLVKLSSVMHKKHSNDEQTFKRSTSIAYKSHGLLDNAMGIVRSLSFNYILKGCASVEFMCQVRLEHSLINRY